VYPIGIYLIAKPSETKRLIERELSSLQAHIDGDFSGFAECLSSLDSANMETKLFIAEVNSEEDISWLAKLNDHFTGFPILAIVRVANAAGLLVSAMRAGAAQVVRIPVDSRDFRDAMKRVATQFGHAPKPCDVIAVLAADQGAGASSVSINLGAELARETENQCLLFEAAPTYGHLADLLNIAPRTTTYELLKSANRLDGGLLEQAITRVDQNFGVISGPYQEIHEDSSNLLELLPALQLARELSDCLVIDVSTDFVESYFEFLNFVDQIVIVGEQRISAVTGIRALLKKLAEREIAARKIVVINKYDWTQYDFNVTSLHKLLGLPELLTIRKDEKLFQNVENRGKTLRQQALYHGIHRDYGRLARVVLRRERIDHRRGFFSRKFFSYHR
jgi:Flp pilus assembly CpaE family ATPase